MHDYPVQEYHLVQFTALYHNKGTLKFENWRVGAFKKVETMKKEK